MTNTDPRTYKANPTEMTADRIEREQASITRWFTNYQGDNPVAAEQATARYRALDFALIEREGC